MREKRTSTSGCGPYQLKMSALLMECIFANIDRVPNGTFNLQSVTKPQLSHRLEVTKNQFIF